MKRKWDLASEDVQRQCVDEIIARIDEIGEDGAGVIAAQDIIEIVTDRLAPFIYNAGIRDAQKLLAQKITDLDTDLSALEVNA